MDLLDLDEEFINLLANIADPASDIPPAVEALEDGFQDLLDIDFINNVPPFEVYCPDSMNAVRQWIDVETTSDFFSFNAESKGRNANNEFMNRMYWRPAVCEQLSVKTPMRELLELEFNGRPRRAINSFCFRDIEDAPVRMEIKQATWKASFTYIRSFAAFLRDFFMRPEFMIAADLETVQPKVKRAIEQKLRNAPGTGSIRVMMAIFEQATADNNMEGGDGSGGTWDNMGGGSPGGRGDEGDVGRGPHGRRGPGFGADRRYASEGGPRGGPDGGETDDLGDEGNNGDSDDEDDDAESVRRDVENIKADIARAMEPMRKGLRRLVHSFKREWEDNLKSAVGGAKLLKDLEKEQDGHLLKCGEAIACLSNGAMLFRSDVQLCKRGLKIMLNQCTKTIVESSRLHDSSQWAAGVKFAPVKTSVVVSSRTEVESLTLRMVTVLPENLLETMREPRTAVRPIAKAFDPVHLFCEKGVNTMSGFLELCRQSYTYVSHKPETSFKEWTPFKKDAKCPFEKELGFGDFKIYSGCNDPAGSGFQSVVIFARMVVILNETCVEYFCVRYSPPDRAGWAKAAVGAVAVAGAVWTGGALGLAMGGVAVVATGVKKARDYYYSTDIDVLVEVQALVIDYLVECKLATLENGSSLCLRC